MPHSHAERREREIKKQGGVSPLTGESLNGRRTQRSHTVARRNGGTETVRLPIEEHAEWHLRESEKRGKSRSERQKDKDVAKSIIRELTPEELNRLNTLRVRNVVKK